MQHLVSQQSLSQIWPYTTAAAPHLANGDYGEVLRRLKIVITKDSNVVCVAEAIACVGALAKVRDHAL